MLSVVQYFLCQVFQANREKKKKLISDSDKKQNFRDGITHHSHYSPTAPLIESTKLSSIASLSLSFSPTEPLLRHTHTSVHDISHSHTLKHHQQEKNKINERRVSSPSIDPLKTLLNKTK